MINKVTLVGNLGRDPEVRRLDNGVVVAKFPVATNESYKDKSGEWQTQTEWHDVVVWRQLAERAERDLKKGKLVYIEGKLTHRKYTDQNNIDRYVTEVVGNMLRILERSERSSSPGQFPGEQDAPPSDSSSPVEPKSNTTNGDDSDDLPF
ncbi:MAG: single-stranded DNA-binding protein [Saprospiraceae bacterium]|nr:single-stranded DNA-binding protein [Saprospiraceae bacterium]